IDGRSLVSVNAFARRDRVNYYPSRDPFHDTPATLAQDRSLVNLGVRSEFSRATRRHIWKAGLNAMQTRLDEEFRLGITDPRYNDPADPAFLRALAPYDLTRGGRLFEFHGKADINQLAL